MLICIDGIFYAIELKVGRNKATRIQDYVLRKIRSAGGKVSVCRSVQDVRKFLKGGKDMIKVGDKLLVKVRVTEVIEDKNGIKYTVIPDDDKRDFQRMSVIKDDIQSYIEQ